MLEALILWQLGSARAEEKSRVRYQNNGEGQGFALFMMGICFVVTIFLWPLALGYRTQLLTKRPAIGWSIIPPLAFLLLIAGFTIYVFIGFFWAIGEMTAYISRNEHMFN